METFGNKFLQKFSNENYCKKCDLLCSTKYNYNKHLLSRRHVVETHLETFGNALLDDAATCKNAVTEQSIMYKCELCSKKYKTRSGLWKHKNICFTNNSATTTTMVTNKSDFHKDKDNDKNAITITDLDKNNIILKLLEQNATLQNQIVELSKEKTTVINHNVTNHNQFNINVFLKEHCKDAINLMDFLDSLQLQITDLETTGKLGYVEGISKIFINGLKELDVYKRPIHCSDLKRETFYIKDSNMWEKDNKEKLKYAIKVITKKNIKQIPNWQKKNPEYYDSENKKNDEYMQIVSSAMCGESADEEHKNYDKIIKNLAKEVMINKEKDNNKDK